MRYINLLLALTLAFVQIRARADGREWLHDGRTDGARLAITAETLQEYCRESGDLHDAFMDGTRGIPEDLIRAANATAKYAAWAEAM